MKKAGYAWFRIRNYMKEKLHSGHRFLTDESGMGTVELILIIVEKPNAKHRYVLCGN